MCDNSSVIKRCQQKAESRAHGTDITASNLATLVEMKEKGFWTNEQFEDAKSKLWKPCFQELFYKNCI